MEHFVNLVEAVAWPVSVVWVAYLFRGEITKLFGRVSSLKYKDMEANFEESLSEAEAKAAQVKVRDAIPTPEAASELDQLLRISEISPRAAVVEAWTLIESAAIKTGLSTGTVIQRTNSKLILEYLESTGKFSPESLELIKKLRQIRNRVSHMPDTSVSQEEAERYLDLATKSASIIESTRS